MRFLKLATAVSITAAIASSGCNDKTGPEPESSAPTPSAAQSQSTAFGAKPDATNFEEMFAAIVKGSLPNATEPDEQASWQVLERIETFSKDQNEAFLAFLEGKLRDPSPFVSMEAAFNVALIRCDLGLGEKNADLIPLFVALLQHKDVMVRKLAMNDMDPLVRNSNLGDKLRPLIPVLTEALKEPFTTYQAVSYLGDLGPLAREAVPSIRMAAKRDNDPTINEASEEAIRKITGNAP